MMNPLKSFILLLITVIDLAALAANEYRQPVVFSWGRQLMTWKIGKSGSPQGYCRIIQIHSLTENKGQVYAQSGVGWVLQAEEGFRVLTPSHVISGADVIAGQCEDRIFPLELQSRTETLDLALLRPLTDIRADVLPLIHLAKREVVQRGLDDQDKEILRVFNPDHFKKSFEETLGRQEKSSYWIPLLEPGTNEMKQFRSAPRDSDSMGIAHFENELSSLVVESLAIRPGFSGAPFFVNVQVDQAPVLDPFSSMNEDAYNQYYLVGMLTKAEVNGSRSLGVSLPVILNILPHLMREQNDAVDVYTASQNLPVRLRYTNVVQNNSLERNQELIYTSPNGEKRIFTEVCEDAAVDSSEWSKDVVSKRDFANLIRDYKSRKDVNEKRRGFDALINSNRKSFDHLKATQQKISGGDYGEGGGNSASLHNSRLMVPDYGRYNLSGALTSYKRQNPCHKVVLKDDLGKVYDAMLMDGHLQKTTNLAEAYKVLSRGAAPPAQREGGPLCSSLSLSIPYGSTSNTGYPALNGTPYFYTRTEGIASVSPEANSVGTLTCSSNQVRIQYREDVMQLNLVLGDVQTVSGSVRIGSCKIEVTKKNYSMANRWKHQIRSPMADLDINLGQKDRLLTFKILRLDNSCYDSSGGQLWMMEVNFSSVEASKKKDSRGNKVQYLKQGGMNREQ